VLNGGDFEAISMFSPWPREIMAMTWRKVIKCLPYLSSSKPLEVPVVDNYYLFFYIFNSCDPVPFLRRAKCNRSDKKYKDYGSYTTSVGDP
jgi:hypothetical protein